MIRRSLLGVVAVLASFAATAQSAQNVRENNALKRIEAAAERLEAGRRADHEKIQVDVANMRHLDGAGGRRFEELLCRLVGATWPKRDDSEVRAVLQTSLSDLQSRMNGADKDEARRHVAELALAGEKVSVATRLGAVLALGRIERAARPPVPKAGEEPTADANPDATESPIVLALFAAVRDPAPAVRAVALDALVGQPSPRATEILAENLADAFAAPAPGDAKARAEHDRVVDAAIDRMRHHVAARESRDVALPEALASRLVDPLVKAWVAPQWRTASRTLHLVPLLPEKAVAAPLVEALEEWTRRGQEAGSGIPTGVDRVRYEIVGALESTFKSSIGMSVPRWRQWLEWYQKGGAGRIAHSSSDNSTVTQFFGLELRSSAVMFVLDTSGSMAFGLAGDTVVAGKDDGPTRYDLALEQIKSVLERKDNPIWFDVVLFDTDVRRLSKGPKQSTAAEVQGLLNWLRSRPPSGGTQLEKGLAAAWPKGTRAPFYDTIIVMCDGATPTFGPQDATAFLESGPLEAGIIVHSIQIGPDEATSLEALAAGTGGRFLRITK